MSRKVSDSLLRNLSLASSVSSVIGVLIIFVSLRNDPVTIIALALIVVASILVVCVAALANRDYVARRFENYSTKCATSKEVGDIYEMQIKHFGKNHNPDPQLMTEWMQKEPRIARLLYLDSRPDRPCGFYLALCLKKSTMRQVVDGKVLDWALDPKFIVPFSRGGSDDVLYIMYIVVERPARSHTSVLMVDLKNFVERVTFEASGLRTLSTMTSTRNGERLAIANSFEFVDRMQYPSGWKYWERQMPKVELIR